MEDYKDLVDLLPFDISIEVFAAQLMELYDLDVQQIVVRPKGLARRKGEKEVAAIQKGYDTFEDRPLYYVDVNREGLFDALPILFFLPEQARGRGDEDVEAKEIAARINDKIAEARKFFLPFEQAFYHTRISIELWERTFSATLSASLEDFWRLQAFLPYLDEQQKATLLYFLPITHCIAGDWVLAKFCFEAILKKTVCIEPIAPPIYPIPETAILDMGKATLGEDFVIGSTFFDGISAIKILIKGVAPNELESFLWEWKEDNEKSFEGSNKKLIEELLCTYFLPLEASVQLDIEPIADPKKDFSLSGTDSYSILGYTTVL